MTLGYRAILKTAASDRNRDDVLRLLTRWFVEQKHFASLDAPEDLRNEGGGILTDYELAGEHGVAWARRWILVEDWAAPKWYTNSETSRTGVTTITLVERDDTLTLWVDVEPPELRYETPSGRRRTELQPSGRPRIVRDILDAVEMRDGVAEPLSEFQTVATNAQVDELAGMLCDETRNGAILVTAPPTGTDAFDWADQATRLVGQIQGMASGYSLTVDAARHFNANYGRAGHFVPQGGLRTFEPGARLADASDASAHRFISPTTMRESSDARIKRIIRNGLLTRINAGRLPLGLRALDYEFLRMARLRPFRRLLDAPTDTAGEVAAADHNLREQLLSVEADALAAFEQNWALEAQVLRLSEDRDEAFLEVDDLYQKSTDARRESEALRVQVRYLQRQLEQFGAAAAQATWTVPEGDPRDIYPETFRELVQRVGELEGVAFTADTEITLELDEHALLGRSIVMKSWDALVSFDAYVAARRDGDFDQSLSHYVTHPSHGHWMRIGKVAWTESESVRSREQFRQERMLKVDERVDASGRKFMAAHIKLSNLTGIAPRLYFDDNYSAAGHVTVGYLGAHMANTLTN